MKNKLIIALVFVSVSGAAQIPGEMPQEMSEEIYVTEEQFEEELFEQRQEEQMDERDLPEEEVDLEDYVSQ